MLKKNQQTSNMHTQLAVAKLAATNRVAVIACAALLGRARELFSPTYQLARQEAGKERRFTIPHLYITKRSQT